MMRRLATHTLVIEIMGWYGMAAVLVAYGLVNLDILASHNVWCILLNLTGSIGLLLAAAIKRADQLVVLNVVWAVVAVIALVELVIK
jgi:hypothetical protein